VPLTLKTFAGRVQADAQTGEGRYEAIVQLSGNALPLFFLDCCRLGKLLRNSAIRSSCKLAREPRIRAWSNAGLKGLAR